jgi:hypothetical protein
LGGPMKIVPIIMCVIMVIWMGSSCRAVVKPSSEIVIMIDDLKCEEVWESVLRSLKDNKIPILMIDKEKEYIKTGPVITSPLPGEPYQRMEEKYLINVKCIELLVTQITCQVQVRGLTKDNKWIEVKKTEKYERRFTDSFKINK